jgi:uncharacterized ion transporter superfamily protein YfcC
MFKRLARIKNMPKLWMIISLVAVIASAGAWLVPIILYYLFKPMDSGIEEVVAEQNTQESSIGREIVEDIVEDQIEDAVINQIKNQSNALENIEPKIEEESEEEQSEKEEKEEYGN